MKGRYSDEYRRDLLLLHGSTNLINGTKKSPEVE